MAGVSAMPGMPTAADANVAMERNANAQLQRMGSMKTSDPREAERVSREFEAMFLSSMLQPMFAGLKTKGPFGGGHAEETFRTMLVDEYGKQIAKAGGVGIAKMVHDQILQLQEVGNK